MADDVTQPIEYDGLLSGTVSIDKKPMGYTFTAGCIVTTPYDPVEYIASIQGQTLINNNRSDIWFPSDVNINPVNMINDLDSTTEIQSNIYDIPIIPGKVSLDHYEDYFYGINSQLYIDKLKKTAWIAGEVSLPFEFNTEVDGTLWLDLLKQENDFLMSVEVIDSITYTDLDCFVDLWAYPLSKYFPGYLEYEQRELDYNNEIIGSVELNTSNHFTDWIMSCNIIKKHYRYSIYSYANIVNCDNTYFFCSCAVKNDQIYEIRGNCDIESNDYETSFDGEVTLPPYTFNEIDSEVTLDQIFTRRDIPCYGYITTPVNYEIMSSCNVYTDWKNIGYEWDCSALVGAEYLQWWFNGYAVIQAVQESQKDIYCKCMISNSRSPRRVVFICDPLWRYEPYVVKSTLTTFFDRIYTKNFIKVITGGTWRFNWDIIHYSRVFGVQTNQIKDVDLYYNPADLCCTKGSVDNLLHEMFHFDCCDPNKNIDRVIIFMNRQLASNNMMMNPILNVCRQYNLPTVIIDSGGDFIELNSCCNHHKPYDHLYDHNHCGYDSLNPPDIV